MTAIEDVVNYLNKNLQNVSFSELLDRCKKFYPNISVEDELVNAGYIFNSSKTKIIKKDLEENLTSDSNEILELDYKKILSFNSKSVLTVRIDSEVDLTFKKFCKEQKGLTKNKIVSLALAEFLAKHN